MEFRGAIRRDNYRFISHSVALGQLPQASTMQNGEAPPPLG
jgi:hypothetical protein